jgi:uridine kinase
MSERVSIEALLSTRQPAAGTTKIVGVDGHGGSGKSTLAELLARQLHAEIVHTDDFASWDNPKNWWPQVIDQVLEPIAAGAKALNYSRSSWWPDHHPEPVVDQPVTDIMILEGVSALRKEFRRYLTFGIFVTAPLEVCLERGLTRDADQGTREEILQKWQQWYKDEEGYIQRDDPERYADVVLDGTRPFVEQLHKEIA